MFWNLYLIPVGAIQAQNGPDPKAEEEYEQAQQVNQDPLVPSPGTPGIHKGIKYRTQGCGQGNDHQGPDHPKLPPFRLNAIGHNQEEGNENKAYACPQHYAFTQLGGVRKLAYKESGVVHYG
jgi:hypothetical protein